MNIILAGDFAHLPPISQYTLYSGSIGTKKLQGVTSEIQEATIGKAAWHQFTTVTTQSTEDGKLRRALQNMRYKACTNADISFLRTLVGGRPANKVKLNQARFCNISVIVGPNAHRDKYNMGSDCYANDINQPLHHFYSMDTLASNILSPELQHVVWNLPHGASQHCAGKFSICHGMPVLVKHNIPTPCCVNNVPINLDGPPMNVVSIGWTAQDVICCLPNDDTLTITRQQVQVLPNFSMTDYRCQGRTRPNNKCICKWDSYFAEF
ncbi:hypothetical protein K439DRAFT_1647894 [Ramaria rubella]|nr:hypothetical protein K439DRAFT_1647894 [Ramaria rubella]